MLQCLTAPGQRIRSSKRVRRSESAQKVKARRTARRRRSARLFPRDAGLLFGRDVLELVELTEAAGDVHDVNVQINVMQGVNDLALLERRGIVDRVRLAMTAERVKGSERFCETSMFLDLN